jgi:hypothetical protein
LLKGFSPAISSYHPRANSKALIQCEDVEKSIAVMGIGTLNVDYWGKLLKPTVYVPTTYVIESA